ncbi:hypothetical protein GC173_14075 [bacterium]|nr:hypothetical protein [bacterium]
MTPPAITYYVISTTQEDPLPPLRPVSRLVQQEEPEVEKKLRTKTYAVLGRFARQANAQGLVQQLTALGVNCYMMSDQEIRGHLIVSMKTANRGQGGIAFRDFEDKPLFCPWDDMAGICVLEIFCERGGQATLIDLHRKSANITPRLDVALFDFGTMMGVAGATFEDFLAELENRTSLRMDRRFAQDYQQVVDASASFGSRPAVFSPPEGQLAEPYDRHSHAAANLYSLVRHAQTRK